MDREVLIWPVGKEAAALAYCDVADAAFATLTDNPEAIFCYRDRFDIHDQQVTPYFGPTGLEYNGAGPDEPAECLVARADAVLASSVDWPSPPEV